MALNHKYAQRNNETAKQELNYFNSILKLDQSKAIFLKLRNKSENAKKQKPVTLRFSITEAVILVDICQNADDIQDFEKFTATKTINQLHEQLLNL
ncbi:hypothetical protein [Flavobacterium sp. GCM10027622]|uniref:hypothetical protein n=1 Tax=unclassified Flavobacterium TaxID=196869 RepID=UPI00361ADEE2